MVYSDAIRTYFLEVGTDENMLKSRMMYGAFWRYLKQYYWSWNCWEFFKSNDAKRCILALYETMVWKLELLRTSWKQGWCMVHSDAIWNNVIEVGTAEKILKARTLNGAFWHYLKRCFGSWNCWEFFENEVAFKMVHSAAIWNDVLEVWNNFINFKLWQNNLFVQLNQ